MTEFHRGQIRNLRSLDAGIRLEETRRLKARGFVHEVLKVAKRLSDDPQARLVDAVAFTSLPSNRAVLGYYLRWAVAQFGNESELTDAMKVLRDRRRSAQPAAGAGAGAGAGPASGSARGRGSSAAPAGGGSISEDDYPYSDCSDEDEYDGIPEAELIERMAAAKPGSVSARTRSTGADGGGESEDEDEDEN
jgi:hypothetical protein